MESVKRRQPEPLPEPISIRDRDVDDAARLFLNMNDEEIFNTHPRDLEAKVRAEVTRRQRASLSFLQANQNTYLPNMTRSEIGEVKSLFQKPEQTFHKTVMPTAEDVRKMQFLTVHFDLKSLIREKHGIQSMAKHVIMVSEEGARLSTKIKEQKDILLLKADCMDDEDLKIFHEGVSQTEKQIELIRNYLQNIYNDLKIFIGERLTTEALLRNCKVENSLEGADRMHLKTVDLQSIAVIIQTFIECP